MQCDAAWGTWFHPQSISPPSLLLGCSHCHILWPPLLAPASHSSLPPRASTVFAKNFRVAAAMKTSVLLSWEVPDSYKSAVPFKVGTLLLTYQSSLPRLLCVAVPIPVHTDVCL